MAGSDAYPGVPYCSISRSEAEFYAMPYNAMLVPRNEEVGRHYVPHTSYCLVVPRKRREPAIRCVTLDTPAIENLGNTNGGEE